MGRKYLSFLCAAPPNLLNEQLNILIEEIKDHNLCPRFDKNYFDILKDDIKEFIKSKFVKRRLFDADFLSFQYEADDTGWLLDLYHIDIQFLSDKLKGKLNTYDIGCFLCDIIDIFRKKLQTLPEDQILIVSIPSYL